MADGEGHVVVVGSGASALAAMASLVGSGMGRRVLVIEGSEQVGGLLGSFRYDIGLTFDVGMHNIQQTGVPSLDNQILSALPDDEWLELSGNRRDLAGLYARGRLNFGSPYESLAPSLQGDEFMERRETACLPKSEPEPTTALDLLERRFGPLASRPYVDALERRYGTGADELDSYASRFTPMERLVVADEAVTSRLYQIPGLSSVIAWPEQRTLPAQLQSGLSSFYPRTFGIQRYVEGALARVVRAGGTVLTSARISSVSHRHGRVESVVVEHDGMSTDVATSWLIWTANPSTLWGIVRDRHQLRRPVSDSAPGAGLQTWVVNLGLTSFPEAMQDLYYFYSYDPNLPIFRVTNYAAYCPSAVVNGLFPLSAEVILTKAVGSAAETRAELEGRIPESLVAAGVINEDSVAFRRAELLSFGFPLPTVGAFRRANEVRANLDELRLANLLLLGIKPESGIFFQRQVTLDAADQVARIEESVS